MIQTQLISNKLKFEVLNLLLLVLSHLAYPYC